LALGGILSTQPAIRCLLSRTPYLKPDDKLFFVFVLSLSERALNPGHFNLIAENGVQLGKRFGFTKEASFRALQKLRDNGLIEELADQGKSGRPRKLRKVVFGRLESGGTNLEVSRATLVQRGARLLSHRLRYGNHNAYAGMKNAIFLLLLILIIKSNCAGIVAKASHADLSALTGIPRSQVQRRLTQLQELGLIEAIIPGLVDGSLLGKPCSIYYLNLRHPLLEATGVSVEPLIIKGKGCTSPEIDQLAMKLGHPGLRDRLASAAKHAAVPTGIKKTRISPGSWEQNAPDLLRRPATKLYTQCVIERYAAKLIGNPNSILSASEWRNEQDHATEDFVQELTGERPTAVKKSREYSRMFYSLCADLEELSHQLASLCIRVGKLPKRASTASTPIITYRILPSGIGKRSEIRLERITLRS
jgi:predicted transcriptional regulator